MSETSRTTSTDPDDKPAGDAKPSGLNLSMSQVAGGSLAAATAALLGSKLGTTGTIIGAALVSFVTAVGGALYTASLRRTREVVVRTREILPTGQWRTIRLPDVQDQPDGSESDVAEADSAGTEVEMVESEDTSSLWSRINWKPVAIVAAVVFGISALIVTVAELATGHEATVVKVVHHPAKTDKSTPVPSPTPSDTTSTSSSPSDDTSQTPSQTPSSSTTPSKNPSSSPSSSPSGSVSPSASPTGTPTP